MVKERWNRMVERNWDFEEALMVKQALSKTQNILLLQRRSSKESGFLWGNETVSFGDVSGTELAEVTQTVWESEPGGTFVGDDETLSALGRAKKVRGWEEVT